MVNETATRIPSMTAAAEPFSRARLAIAIAAAVVLNLIAFWAGTAAGASMTIDSPAYSSIAVAMVVLATAAPLALAGVVTWFIARRRPVFRTWAAWLGLGLALVSLPSPLLIAEDPQTGLALAAMHIVAGVAWFIGVRRPSSAH